MATFATLLVWVAIFFLVSNALAWVALRAVPGLLSSEYERLQMRYIDRFQGELKPYIPKWFDIAAEEWPAFRKEYSKAESGSHIYESFVEFRHPVVSGRYINIDAAGFRHGKDQGPWPLSAEFLNIFFFGGSTALNVGPDWTTIASYLQADLNRHNLEKPVRIYNFGRGSYFSTQERILFQQLLLDGHIPDMAIFLDGVNDCFFAEGKPATWGIFAHALDAHNRESYEALLGKRRARPKWRKLWDFLWSLPLALVVERIGAAIADRGADLSYRPPAINPAETKASVNRWLANKRQIEALAREFGVDAVFVWQPTPAYKYDLAYHVALNAHYGLGGHERSGAGYAYIADRLHELPLGREFVWLADIQEAAREELYLDNMHYTAPFSQTIANRIAEAMIERKLVNEARRVTRDPVTPAA
jgi:hypothetical protein